MDSTKFRILLAALCIAAAILFLRGCGPEVRPVVEVNTDPTQIAEATLIQIGNDDWPWWRGSTGLNVAPEQSVPTSWSETDNVVWKAAVPGRGHGTPTIVGGRIFLCTANENEESQSVVCFDRKTGDQLWLKTVHTGGLPARSEMHPVGTHANCTVACDGNAVFVGFLNSQQVTATSLTLDGEIQWQQDLGYFASRFGYGPSPCLYKSLAIFAADNRGGGFIAAVHRDTGDIVWRIARNNADSYSPVVVATIDGTDQLLISGDNHVASYDPLTGEELWSCPGTTDTTCGTAVWQDNLVFASGGYPEQQTICIDATTGKKVWDDRVKCYEQSMLVANGHLFAVNNDGIAICRETRTGKVKWKQRLQGGISASPLLVGDLIFATNESGTTWVFEANPDQYKQVAKNQLGSESFASLIACGGRIYARVADRQNGERQETLYCIGNETKSVSAETD